LPCHFRKFPEPTPNRAEISQKISPHVLRHTFATLALQKNISIAAVQKILGHDRLATTAIYLNLTESHVMEEYQQKW
jgi:integrase/recombinase XerD